MRPNAIKFRGGYKYQCLEKRRILTRFVPSTEMQCGPLIRFAPHPLDSLGVIDIEWGYAWDGVSGPGPDRKEGGWVAKILGSNMDPSYDHDVKFQIARSGFIEPSRHAEFVEIANDEYRTDLIKWGATRIAAATEYRILQRFGGKYAAAKGA